MARRRSRIVAVRDRPRRRLASRSRRPQPRPGLEATFQPAEIAASVNLASAERAAELTALARRRRRCRCWRRPGAAGRARPPLPRRAALLHGDLRPRPRLRRGLETTARSRADPATQDTGREAAVARGIGVHTCSSGARPTTGGSLTRSWSVASASAGVGRRGNGHLLAPFQAWTASSFFAERIGRRGGPGPRCRC